MFKKCFIFREKFHITADDYIYFGTELTFDPSLIEILLSALTGACLFIPSEKAKLNPNVLYNTLFPRDFTSSEHQGITILQTVPSVFKRWTKEQQSEILMSNRLKILAFGGEPFPSEILDNYNISSRMELFNLYGITEVSCWATVSKVNKNCKMICLGEALDDTIIEVRNIKGEIITDKEGEIFIGKYSLSLCCSADYIHWLYCCIYTFYVNSSLVDY